MDRVAMLEGLLAARKELSTIVEGQWTCYTQDSISNVATVSNIRNRILEEIAYLSTEATNNEVQMFLDRWMYMVSIIDQIDITPWLKPYKVLYKGVSDARESLVDRIADTCIVEGIKEDNDS